MGSNHVDYALSVDQELVARQLLALDEDQWFDRKSIRISPRDLAKALVGFANAEGGVVVVGLSEGALEDLNGATTMINELRQVPLEFTRPPVRARYEEVAAASGELRSRLLVIRVSPGEAVHELTNGDCFLRVGDETRKLSYEQRTELHYDRGPSPYDGQPVQGVTLGDLDNANSADYMAALATRQPLRRVLEARSLLTTNGAPTVAALLLFGEEPGRVMPNAHVRVLVYTASARGSGSRQNLEPRGDLRIEGPIPSIIHEAVGVIASRVPQRRALTADGTFGVVDVIPRDAWLEGLVNAVVHRSYSAAGDHIRVEIFPDRIEIESPGRFPGIVDPDRPLDIKRYARNPRIARVCHDLAITQELGEGIRRMFDEMRAMGLSDPLYRQTSGSVRLVLSTTTRLDADLARSLPKGAEAVLRLLRSTSTPLGTGDVQRHFDRSRPWAIRILNALQNADLIEWQGNSPKDPRATWIPRD